MTEAETILKRLSQPLEVSRVKYRPMPGDGTAPFLEVLDVIRIANDIFGYRWSFELLSLPQVMVWEQILTAWDAEGCEQTPMHEPSTRQPKTQRVGMVYLTGKVTLEIDGKPYSHADVGRLSFCGDSPEALDTALSGAATDCLKRCFRQLGDQFGLSLDAKDMTKSTSSGKGGNGRRPAPGHPPDQPNGTDSMSIDQARSVLCPVGSSQNPQWAGMPLGQVINQPNGEKMLAYLASEKFKDNADPARKQAQSAAQVLQKLIQTEGV